MIECSLLSRDLWNPQELATAGQRFLLLYVSLSDSDPEGMFWRFKPKHHLFHRSYVSLMSAALLRIGWRYGWDSSCYFEKKGWRTLFAIWCFLFFPWLILIRFDATDQSHLRKIQLLQLPEIHCTNSCLNTNFQSGLLHEEEKRNSCEEDTSTQLFFVHLFAHDLRPRRCLLHLDWFKYMKIKISWEKDFYKEMRKESLLRG